jgi:hypothetical protein
MWKLYSFHLETVLVSEQDTYMVCTRHTIGSEIILDAPDGTTRLKWKLISILSKIVLILTQDRCMICIERAIRLEIILDVPNGTLR